MNPSHAEELKSGERFAFGRNWSHFLSVLNDERIGRAERSLLEMLETRSLDGKSFLDVGSGSGLFSLAARRLGASVYSFDNDPQCVACTAELKRRYYPDDPQWTVTVGSVLDKDYLAGLGTFDVVYSWGVLHHTGAMWQALENVAPLVADGGRLFVALGNDQGGWSRRWRLLKRMYNKMPRLLKPLYAALVLGPRELRFFLLDCLKGRPWNYFDNIIHYADRSTRGMSYRHDLIDWIGGYPFETAKPEEVFMFFRDRGFVLRQLKTNRASIACNEFVFLRAANPNELVTASGK